MLGSLFFILAGLQAELLILAQLRLLKTQASNASNQSPVWRLKPAVWLTAHSLFELTNFVSRFRGSTQKLWTCGEGTKTPLSPLNIWVVVMKVGGYRKQSWQQWKALKEMDNTFTSSHYTKVKSKYLAYEHRRLCGGDTIWSQSLNSSDRAAGSSCQSWRFDPFYSIK